jgi:hypothetical protein
MGEVQMNLKPYFLGVLIALTLLPACASRQSSPSVNATRPFSHEAELVEVTSSSEWLIRATGYAERKHKHRELEAVSDARAAAIYFMLLGGTDPLLQIPEERERFKTVAARLYAPDEVAKYIAWESTKFIQRVEIDGGKRLKVVKDFKVNRQLLHEFLVETGVVQPMDALTLGHPTIMVIPGVEPGADPIIALADPLTSHIAGAIESHLTAQGFAVLIPTQQVMVDETVHASRTLEGIFTDRQRALALAFGSDIYIVFSILWDEQSAVGTDLLKAAVTMRAFETTTARALGTETGYSRARPAREEVVAEEAVNDALPKILSRMERYWKEDRALGFQYLAHLSFKESLSEQSTQALQGSIVDRLRQESGVRYLKEEIATAKSCDYRLWCEPDRITSARELARMIERAIHEVSPAAAVRTPLLTRKIAILEVSGAPR